MNIYNKISRRTLDNYYVKMFIVRMKMLVGDRKCNYFRVNFSETINPRRLIFSDMIENVKRMQNMKKTEIGPASLHICRTVLNSNLIFF